MKNARLLFLLFAFLSLANIVSASSVSALHNVHIIKDYGGASSSLRANRQVSSSIIGCGHSYHIYADNHTDTQVSILINFTKPVFNKHFSGTIIIGKGKEDIKFYTRSKPKLVIIKNGQTTIEEIVDEAKYISDMASEWPLTKMAFKNAISADEIYIAMPMNNGDTAWIFIPKDVLKLWNDISTNNIDYTLE